MGHREKGTKTSFPGEFSSNFSHNTTLLETGFGTKSNKMMISLGRTNCTVQGTLLNYMWQPGREGSLGEDGYMGMYGWALLLST